MGDDDLGYRDDGREVWEIAEKEGGRKNKRKPKLGPNEGALAQYLKPESMSASRSKANLSNAASKKASATVNATESNEMMKKMLDQLD